MNSSNRSLKATGQVLTLATLLLLTACGSFSASPEEEAMQYAMSACGVEESSSTGTYESSFSGEGTMWYFNQISLTDLKDKKDYFAAVSQYATRAAMLDPSWDSLPDPASEISGFLENLYGIRKSDGYLGDIASEGFNSPLGKLKNICSVVADLANS